MSVPRVLVQSVSEASCSLDPAQSHYLLRVRRLTAGSRVEAVDGSGRRRTALLALDRGEARLDWEEPTLIAEQPSPIWLCSALLKGPAMDLALRQATEAGMTHFAPFVADRSVPDDGRPERWERIVEAALRQSGRAYRPTLLPACSLSDRLRSLPVDLPRYVATWKLGGAEPGPGGTGAVFVGPEGGFSPAEEQKLSEACSPLWLGPYILRAETAAVLAVGALARSPADRELLKDESR